MHTDRQLNGVSDPLVYDTTDREAVGAAVVVIGIDVARAEVQAVTASSTIGCGHPVDAVRANGAELTCIVATTPRGWEE